MMTNSPLVHLTVPLRSREIAYCTILHYARKTCEHDAISTSLLLECLHEILPILTDVVNHLTDWRESPSILKTAIVKPLLKDITGLDLKIYRPVCNISFKVRSTWESCANSSITTHSSAKWFPISISSVSWHREGHCHVRIRFTATSHIVGQTHENTFFRKKVNGPEKDLCWL